jgi:hypothetical protein
MFLNFNFDTSKEQLILETVHGSLNVKSVLNFFASRQAVNVYVHEVMIGLL